MMINNSAGFVRRGVGGSILLWLHDLLSEPFLHELGFILAITTITASSLPILSDCMRLSQFDGFLVMHLPLSYPSFLAYAVETLFRKDSLVILLVIAALLGLNLPARRQPVFLASMACAALPLLTLIHEKTPFFCLAPRF